MSNEDKKVRIMQLMSELDEPLLEFLDIDSDYMLDEKIKVLEQLKQGKKIDEIYNFYEILELNMDYNWD
jgi:hypothetical protein